MNITTKLQHRMSTYTVTVSTSERSDSIQIDASTRSDAISKARQWYKMEYAPPRLSAKYKASSEKSESNLRWSEEQCEWI